MQIRPVIILQRKGLPQVDIRKLRQTGADAFDESVIIQRRITVFCRQKGVFVRDHREKDPAPLQIVLADPADPLRRMVQRGVVLGIFQLRGIAPGQIDPVHILLTKEIPGDQRLQPSEGLPQGKLIRRSRLRLFGILPGNQSGSAELRRLSQQTALADGDLIRRAQRAPKPKPQQKPAQKQQDGKIFPLLHVRRPPQKRKYRKGLKEPSTRYAVFTSSRAASAGASASVWSLPPRRLLRHRSMSRAGMGVAPRIAISSTAP